MKKIAFFGGSFNPPTFAHLEILKECLKQMKFDEAFFVPVGNLYKKYGLIDENDRYNMLKLMCEGEKNIGVLDVILKQGIPLKAIDSFKIIESIYKNKNVKIYFIMGADNFEKIPNWESFEELVKNYNLIIFTRDGIDVEKIIKNNEVLARNRNRINIINIFKYQELSSKMVRSSINSINMDEAKKYTKSSVVEYALKHNIYCSALYF